MRKTLATNFKALLEEFLFKQLSKTKLMLARTYDSFREKNSEKCETITYYL